MNCRNLLPWRGLVKKSATILLVGQYSIWRSPFLIRSVMKKYLIFRCLVLLELEALPLFSGRIAELIILVNYCWVDVLSLAFQEIISPAEMRHQIISCNKFRLCWASGVYYLLDGGGDKGSFYQRCGSTCLASGIWVNSVGSIDPPFHNVCGIGAQNQRQFLFAT